MAESFDSDSRNRVVDHLDDDGVRRFRDRAFAPEELLRVARHLGECEACRERVAQASNATASAASLRRALAADDADAHLDFDAELVPYVERTLSAGDARAVDEHLVTCAMCRREVAD